MAPRFAIVSYYLYTKNAGNFCTDNTEASHAPCALERGQSWLEGGGNNISENRFSTEQKK
jgi:hypothetical protein